MPVPDVRVEHRIAASATELYRLISDVTRMGEWSPENLRGRWHRGADGPRVGARFTGANRRGWRRWWTTCTVVTADPGRVFAFNVALAGIPVSRWTYEFTPDGDNTLVTETWKDRRPRLLQVVADATMGISDIREHNQRSMETTLANLRAVAES